MKTQQLSGALKTPTTTDLELDLGEGLDDVFYSTTGKLSRGQELVVLARTHHDLPEEVTIRGRLGGEPQVLVGAEHRDVDHGLHGPGERARGEHGEAHGRAGVLWLPAFATGTTVPLADLPAVLEELPRISALALASALSPETKAKLEAPFTVFMNPHPMRIETSSYVPNLRSEPRTAPRKE